MKKMLGRGLVLLNPFWRWLSGQSIKHPYLKKKHLSCTWGIKGCFWLGVLAGLGWAPYHSLGTLMCAWSFFLTRLVFCPSAKQVFWAAWFWGLGLYGSTLLWIGNSLMIDPGRFAWFWPLVLVFIGFWSLGPAVFSWITACLKRKFFWQPSSFILAMSGGFSLMEYVQGQLGFPWNLGAYAWGKYPVMIQSVSFWGSYGLSLWTWCIFSIPAIVLSTFFLEKIKTEGLISPDRAQEKTFPFYVYKGVLSLGLALAIQAGVGFVRLSQHPVTFLQKGPLLRLVQPSIPLKERMDPRWRHHHFSTLVELSTSPSLYLAKQIKKEKGTIFTPEAQHKGQSAFPKKGFSFSEDGRKNHLMPNYVIWPEGTLPWSLSSEELSRLPPLCGHKAPFSIFFNAGFKDEDQRFHNAIMMQSAQGKTQWIYSKSILVPFGEYLPGRCYWERLLPAQWLKKITPGHTDYEAVDDQEKKVYKGEDATLPPVRPLICFESIFPGCLQISKPQIAGSQTPGDPVKTKPRWILVFTNDGWFGISQGPYQHFVSAQFRALESGLPLLRAANTGVSGVIDALGRVTHRLDLCERGYIDTFLQPALEDTVYNQYKEWPWFFSLILLAFFIVFSSKKTSFLKKASKNSQKKKGGEKF